MGKNGKGRPIYRNLEPLDSRQVVKFGEETEEKDARHEKRGRKASFVGGGGAPLEATVAAAHRLWRQWPSLRVAG